MSFFILLVFIMILGVLTGPVEIVWSNIFIEGTQDHLIVTKLRFPRLVNAFLVGACLACAGAAFQGILKNPLADPYILGVSSGSALGAAIVIILGISTWHILALPIGAVLGALLTIFLVYGIVIKANTSTTETFILAGIIVNSFFAALMMLLFYLSNHQLSQIMTWLMGDLSGVTVNWIYISLGIVLIIFLSLYRVSNQLNIAAIGDQHAQLLGLHVDQLRKIVFVLASCLTGLAVSNSGMIGFIGLVVPHMVRLIHGNDFRKLLPLSFFSGGLFLMLVDIISRLIMPITPLPIGVITSFFGAPFFLYLLLRSKKNHDPL